MPREFSDYEVYIRVDVEEPWMRSTGDTLEERMAQDERRCSEVIRSIARHVDDVENAYVQIDREYECSYCGSSWTEDSSEFNGGCCDEDMEHVLEPEEGI